MPVSDKQILAYLHYKKGEVPMNGGDINDGELREAIHFYKPNELENGLIRPIVYDEEPKGFEEKTYLILYLSNDGNETSGWKACTGRTETYEFIKDMIDEIDIRKSLVLVETKKQDIKTGERGYYLMGLDKAISVYTFCKTVEEYYPEDPFDIDDYDYQKTEPDYTPSDVEMQAFRNSESYDIWSAVLNGELPKQEDSNEPFDPDDEKYNI